MTSVSWEFWQSDSPVECIRCRSTVPAHDIWEGRVRNRPVCKPCIQAEPEYSGPATDAAAMGGRADHSIMDRTPEEHTLAVVADMDEALRKHPNSQFIVEYGVGIHCFSARFHYNAPNWLAVQSSAQVTLIGALANLLQALQDVRTCPRDYRF